MSKPDQIAIEQERNWARKLERGRLGSALLGGTKFPGPGAAAADSGSGPIPFTSSSGSSDPTAAPSVAETGKVAAQVASGAGVAKLAAEEMQKVAMQIGKEGLLSTVKNFWAVANKWVPWIILFTAYSLLFEEPFLTVPLLLLAAWTWIAGAHWLKIKWLRTFNILELLATILLTILYLAALTLILMIITLAIGAVNQLFPGINFI